MQKLVTICLSGHKITHGVVEEHLADYLAKGWRISSVCAAGGSSAYATATAWIVVVLERLQQQ
jgi:hypothetical protein